MDFQLEWIEILNYTISKILTEKMILILNIGMNWKTDLLSQLLGLFCFLGDVGGGIWKILKDGKASWKRVEISKISALKSLRRGGGGIYDYNVSLSPNL